MINLGTLYTYELKKILNRKIVWITFTLLLLITVLISLGGILFGSYERDGEPITGYQIVVENRSFARNLSGRAIDNTLFEEIRQEGENEETFRIYKNIYIHMWEIMGYQEESIQEISAETLYHTRKENIRRIWNDQKLTPKEINFWQEKEKEIRTPFIYGYTENYQTILSSAYTLNIMIPLFLAICLSSVFSDEHLRKTDQLTLCSRFGKKQLYLAKLFAGLTFGIGTVVFFFTVSTLLVLLIYGTEGFHTALQLLLPHSSFTFSTGQTIGIIFALLTAASLLYSALAMFLSEYFKSSIAAMSVITVSIILPMILDIPEKFRILAQIYSYLPATSAAIWNFMDNRLIPFFGSYLTYFQFAPLLYLVLIFLLAITGSRVYQRYQVSGR